MISQKDLEAQVTLMTCALIFLDQYGIELKAKLAYLILKGLGLHLDKPSKYVSTLFQQKDGSLKTYIYISTI